MFDNSPNNPRIPSFLRFVLAVECSAVLAAALLLFFFPKLAAELWAWEIPPFNARFVGAIYFAAYIPLLIFWFNPRWTPGRLILWNIFVFTTLIMVVMFLHVNAFAWNRYATYFIFFPLYIFLPINSAVFLFLSRNMTVSNPIDMPPAWRPILILFVVSGMAYGVGLLIAPEALTRFWPWPVDAFHARIYASAFLTPAVSSWILIQRRGAASEYLTFGFNLLAGGILPILGMLLTNLSVPPERQVNFGNAGTWAFIFMFLITGIMGIAQLVLVSKRSNKMENQ